MTRLAPAGFLAGSLLLLTGCGLDPHPTYPAPQSAPYQPPPLGTMEPVYSSLPTPYESICRSAINRRYGLVVGKNFISSGALLENDLLLTAAHNYASFQPMAFSVVRDRSVECGVGVASAVTPKWRVEGGFHRKHQVRHPREFRKFRWQFDYALIALKQVAPWTSSFRLPTPGENLIAEDSIVFIAGYPGAGSLLYHGRARVTGLTSSEFYYDLNTRKGLSGSPVWVQKEGTFVLVGIHVGLKSTDDGPRGIAHRLNDESLRNLEAWRTEFRKQR